MIILNDAQLHGRSREGGSTLMRGEGRIGGNMEGEVEVCWQVGEEGKGQMTFNYMERNYVC